MRINPDLSGAFAVLIWALAAAVTAVAGRQVPPLQLMSVTSMAVFASMLAFWWLRGENTVQKFHMPIKTYVFGVYGFGCYGTLYFLAFKFAPAFEASLLNYLWPAFLIVFSAMLAGIGQAGGQ